MAGNGRVLALGMKGQLLLLEARPDRYALAGRLQLFADARHGGQARTEIWSRSALTPGRLYVRTQTEVVRFLLGG